MIDGLDEYSVLLGSKSPRRRELLSKLDLQFDAVIIDADESFSDSMPIDEVAEYLAVKKSKAYKGDLNQTILITSDTTVLSGSEILNKPSDSKEATAMLQMLSGRTHVVQTGVCLRSNTFLNSFSEQTEVVFKALTAEEITYYIERYQPFDKAGGYGIQEWIGMIGITSINGCYYNVMGLPISKLYKELCSCIKK